MFQRTMPRKLTEVLPSMNIYIRPGVTELHTHHGIALGYKIHLNKLFEQSSRGAAIGDQVRYHSSEREAHAKVDPCPTVKSRSESNQPIMVHIPSRSKKRHGEFPIT